MAADAPEPPSQSVTPKAGVPEALDAATDTALGAWVSASTGLPAPLAIGLVRTASRMLGSTLGYPAAWIERAVTEVRDGTKNRSLLNNALAKAATDMAVADPELVERMKLSLLSESLRKQTNKEAVFASAALQIKSESDRGAEVEIEEASDDWLNSFIRYAEDASSDRLRDIWGRVLAGKLRKRGDFGPQALRAVAEMDQATATHFETISRKRTYNFLLKPENAELEGDELGWMSDLEAAGLLFGVDGSRMVKISLNKIGVAGVPSGDWVLVLRGQPEAIITVTTYSFTKAGMQLASISAEPNHDENLRNLAQRLQKAPVRGLVLTGPTSAERTEAGEVLWEVEPGAALASRLAS